MHRMTSTQVRETHRTPLSQALTGTCPDCKGSCETCRCTGVATLAPRAGTIGDTIRREDDQSGDDGRGYERDETERFYRIVKQLVVDGDDRAAVAGRRARRTLKDMTGQSLPPVLQMLTRTVTFAPSAPAAGAACTSCQGAGGKEVDTSSDGVSRQNWQSCQPCGGTGVAR